MLHNECIYEFMSISAWRRHTFIFLDELSDFPRVGCNSFVFEHRRFNVEEGMASQRTEVHSRRSRSDGTYCDAVDVVVWDTNATKELRKH